MANDDAALRDLASAESVLDAFSGAQLATDEAYLLRGCLYALASIARQLYDAGGQADTYPPPPEPPDGQPDTYRCKSPMCGYEFHLYPDGMWVGPYYNDDRPNSAVQPLTWEQLQDGWGDCAANLRRV